MKNIYIISSMVLFGFTMTSCNKEGAKTQYSYEMRMTDAPAPYEEVNIDIQGVELKGSDGKLVMMNINAGIYNLLSFSNGLDTLIASATLEVGNVKQIRLILGSNNTVVVDKMIYPLSTPSAEQSGLKLNVNHELKAGLMFSVLIDFDANLSIIKEGNGSYKLKPVIRIIGAEQVGSIKGSITPIGVLASITATSASNDIYTTNVNTKGEFMLKGLPIGIYSIMVTPLLPLKAVEIINVEVVNSTKTDIGIIVLN